MDDLIRRGALIDVLANRVPFAIVTADDAAFAYGLDAAYMAVKEAPPVDAVEVVHAKWIEEPEHIPHCSRCGLYSDDADYGRANYCPGCGARMDAEVISEMETTTREKEAKQGG